MIRDGLWLGGVDDACNTSQLHKQVMTMWLTTQFLSSPDFLHRVRMADSFASHSHPGYHPYTDRGVSTLALEQSKRLRLQVHPC